MKHIFEFILSDYLGDNDRKTLSQGYYLAIFKHPYISLLVNVNWNDDYALGYESRSGCLDIMRYPVEFCGCNIHSFNDYVLRWASRINY